MGGGKKKWQLAEESWLRGENKGKRDLSVRVFAKEGKKRKGSRINVRYSIRIKEGRKKEKEVRGQIATSPCKGNEKREEENEGRTKKRKKREERRLCRRSP